MLSLEIAFSGPGATPVKYVVQFPKHHRTCHAHALEVGEHLVYTDNIRVAQVDFRQMYLCAIGDRLPTASLTTIGCKLRLCALSAVAQIMVVAAAQICWMLSTSPSRGSKN